MNEIIDYAYPCMMTERAMKQLHDAMLDKRYDEAIQHGLLAIQQAAQTVEAILDTQKMEGQKK
jgi:hypothetical protein